MHKGHWVTLSFRLYQVLSSVLAEKLNRLSRAHERYRRTGGSIYIANVSR